MKKCKNTPESVIGEWPKHCTDGCAFGARRRRLREILAVHRLLKKTGGPVYEVWFTRPAWAPPSGELRSVSIPSIKKLNGRVLDKLLGPGAVAVGTVKALSDSQEPTWTVQVHEVIAGVDKAELDRVFAGIAYVKALKPQDVGQAIARVLQRDPDVWKGFSPPKAKRRAEFYEWTLNMPIDARVIRRAFSEGASRDLSATKLGTAPAPESAERGRGRETRSWSPSGSVQLLCVRAPDNSRTGVQVFAD